MLDLQSQLAALGAMIPPAPAGMPAAPPVIIPQMMQIPVPPAAPAAAPAVDPAAIQRTVQDAVQQAMPSLMSILGPVDALFRRALPEADYAEYLKFLQGGAPGFGQLFQSEKLYPIVQLLWDEIKGSQS